MFDESSLANAAQNGPSSTEYSKIISSLVSELRLFYEIEEKVHAITGITDKIIDKLTNSL